MSGNELARLSVANTFRAGYIALVHSLRSTHNFVYMSHRTDVPIHSKRKSTRHSDSEPEGPTTTLSVSLSCLPAFESLTLISRASLLAVRFTIRHRLVPKHQHLNGTSGHGRPRRANWSGVIFLSSYTFCSYTANSPPCTVESQSAPKNSKPRRPAPSASARKHRTIQSPDATDDENGGAIAGQARNAGTAGK